ncbi:MAG: VanZ family protein [Desulfatibacillaceae bacterium]|nr:VanZ family protein [Desulfatibacillaceae bacterium]
MTLYGTKTGASLKIRWALVLLYCAYLFFLSSMPGSDTPPPFPHFDKIIHFGLYAVLGALMLNALLLQAPGMGAGSRIAIAALICALYGVTDEIHQHFVPTRKMDVLDMLANALGSAFGAFAAQRFARRKAK